MGQYVALFSLRETYRDFQWGEFKEQEVLAKLTAKLRDTKEPRFVALEEYQGMEERWNKYLKWKRNVNRSGLGYNSERSDVYYTFINLVTHVQLEGLPDRLLMSSDYKVAGEILIEHNLMLEAVRWMIYFGHDKEISQEFRFENLSKLTLERRKEIIDVSFVSYERLCGWLNVPLAARFWGYAREWIKALPTGKLNPL